MIQNAKLTRAKSYNDILQHLDIKPLKNALQWCYLEQVNAKGVIYNTDIRYNSSIYDEYMNDIDVIMKENRQQE